MELSQGNSRWDLEALEGRVLLSLACDADVDFAAAKGGGAAAAPAIRLDLVTLHELGHSLGLQHDASEAVSIMDPYYNPDYDINYFMSGQDPAVMVLRQMYAEVNASGWKDLLDAKPGNGRVDLTYSFVADGTRMEQGVSTAFKSFDGLYGSAATWQGIVVAQLQRWAAVSEGKLAFSQTTDNGAAFNTRGRVQNDPRFGDIRIGAHRFDGEGKTLAHAFYPPPNGYTASGDLHLDATENWDGMKTAASPTPAPAQGAGQNAKAEESGEAAVFARKGIEMASGAVRGENAVLSDRWNELLETRVTVL